MQIKQLFADEDAVSPVIGVILMVAITVILAAVIGTFVLGLGDNMNNSAPQVNFQFDYGSSTVDITHNGGDNIEYDNIEVTGSDTPTFTLNGGSGSTFSTGDEIVSGESYTAGEDIRVIWNNPSGGSSSTIGSSTAPA